jgi:uncharacterized OB-fold protein
VPAPRPIVPGLFTTTGAQPRLVAARCEACARLHFPATTSCVYCGGADCRACEVGPAGVLFLFTSVATRPPGYRGTVPFGFGVVELPEGVRVVTRLTEADVTKLRPGQPMRLVVEALCTDDDGTPVVSYAFAPEAS